MIRPPREAAKDAQKKQIKGPTREFFKFRYLCFKCRDAARTIDFYKSCGMSLDFDGEQSYYKYSANNAQKPAKVVTTMESTHMKKLPDEEGETEESPSEGLCGRIFGLSYPPNGGGVAAQATKIQLMFQEDKEHLVDEKYNTEAANHAANASRVSTPFTRNSSGQVKKTGVEKLKRNGLRTEYMVIYVRFIHRIVKRIISKGFDISLEVTQIDNNIKIAILRDPNDIEIRLIEMPDTYLNEASSKQWFARLGYYTIPTSFADSSTLLYESLFQARQVKPAQNTKERKEKEEPQPTISIRKLGPSATVKNALTKGTGFRIVDMDELVVGLTHSVFYWMGNDMRTSSCAICFNEVSNADTGEAVSSFEKDKSPLISIGFEVPNLDAVAAKLKYETKNSLSWDINRYKVAKIGQMARFKDSINGIFLDLICTKMDIAGPKFGQKPIGKGKKDAAEDYSIDLNHLRGLARAFSYGSICFTKGYGWELNKDLPPPAEETQKVAKKAITILIEETPNGEEDHANEEKPKVAVGVGREQKKIRSILGRIREAEIQVIENLLFREKSKSI